jgi:putative transposase
MPLLGDSVKRHGVIAIKFDSCTKVGYHMNMRSAFRCRAYPDEAQQALLARTFGCVRVVWNRTLAARYARWRAEGKGTGYAETDRALTMMKREPGLEFLNLVSAVPLQQALRHQHAAFTAFFAKRARYPRFKSRRFRQSATFTRAAFQMRDSQLWLAKTTAPLRFVWSWPDADVAALDPTSVTVSRDRTAAGTLPSTLTSRTQSQWPLPGTLSAWISASRTSP